MVYVELYYFEAPISYVITTAFESCWTSSVCGRRRRRPDFLDEGRVSRENLHRSPPSCDSTHPFPSPLQMLTHPSNAVAAVAYPFVR